MSPVFAARRRAEEFHSLVERAPTSGSDDARYDELLELVGELREVPRTEPVHARAEFVSDLRERLMTAAATELGRTGPSLEVKDRLTVPARKVARDRRLAVAVGGFAIVGATTSMAVAAQSALPGDVLYPLKRAIENAHTGVSVGDSQKGSTLLANASGRLAEVDELTRSDDQPDVVAIEETLQTFNEQAEEASDLLLAEYSSNGSDDALDELQTFTQDSFSALDHLSALVPDEARDALVSAGQVLAGIEAAVQQVCPACPDLVTQIPQWLLSSLGQTLGGEALPTPGTQPASVGGASPGPGDGRGQDGGRTEDEGRPGPVKNVPPTLPTLPGQPTPSGQSGSETPPAEPRPSGPVGDLIDGLLGTGGNDGGSGGDGKGGKGGGKNNGSVPTKNPATDLLQGVGDVVDGLTGPLLGPPKKPQD